MRTPLAAGCLAISLHLAYGVLSSAVNAQEPPSPPAPLQQPDLNAVGLQLQLLSRNINTFQRRDISNAVRQAAREMAGRPLEVLTMVRKVTESEVELVVRDTERARVTIQHRSAPPTGNLRTIYYPGGPSTQRANLLSQPVALRIGSEISLDEAKKLAKGQLLLVRGKIESVRVHYDGWFRPQVIAVVEDWSVFEQ
jgi:hypothetical protein